MFRVCLFWHNINSVNYGVSALAIAHIDLLAKVALKNDVEIEFDTWGTPSSNSLAIHQEIENRLNVKINHKRFGTKTILKNLLYFKWNKINPFIQNKYDFVFDIGEGDSFADIYGLRRFGLTCLSKYFAITTKVPLIIAPQTLGPFNYRLSKWWAKSLLIRSDRIFVRDHKSSSLLNSLNIDNTEVSDIAFLLPYDKGVKQADSVGINVSGLLWHGGYSKNNQFNLSFDYKKFILELINNFLERDKKVYLIGHVITDSSVVEDDYRTIQEIKKRNYSKHPNVEVAPRFKSPIEAKSFISSLSFFTGSRMHATIGAVSSGVPTVPLAYSRKFSGVFESIEYPYTVDLYGDYRLAEVIDKVMKLFDDDLNNIEENAIASGLLAKDQMSEYERYLESIIR